MTWKRIGMLGSKGKNLIEASASQTDIEKGVRMTDVLAEIISRMVVFHGRDIARINHFFAVHGFARAIGGCEGLTTEQMFILEAAAILHDIGIKPSEEKYNSSAPRYQEAEGPPATRQLLAGMDISSARLDRICHLIGNHHSYDKIDDVVFRILVEADFLVNIGSGEFKPLPEIRNRHFQTASGKKLYDAMFAGEPGV